MGQVYPEKRREATWYYALNGNLQIEKAYQIMYKDATRYMDRKYKKFQELLK